MSKAKIMVVEDEWVIADDLRSQLENMDYHVTSIVSSGEDALKKADEEHPDLVLMDIVLSGRMNGIDTAAEIKKSFGIPHIFITAYADNAMVEKAKKTEPFGYLLKPFDDKELNAVIEMALYKDKMEKKFRINELRLAESQKIAHIGTWEYDVVKDELWWSDETYRIFGLDPKKDYPSSEALFETIHPEDQEILKKEILSGKDYRTDYRIILPNGKITYIHEEVRILEERDGKPSLSRGTAQDVTERKIAEAKLKESEIKFRSLFNQATDCILLLSPSDDGPVIVDCNEATLSMHGYTKEELIGKPIAFLDDPENAEKVPARILEIKDKGSACFEALHVRKDNTTFPIEINAQVIKINDEPFILTIDRDITERKKAERELEQIFDLSADMICIADIHGCFTKINPAFEKILGYTDKELMEKPFIDFVHPDDKNKTLDIVNSKLAKGSRVIYFENRYMCKDGTYKWLSWVSSPVPKEGITYAIARDVTERRQAEEKLLWFNKLMQYIISHAQSAIAVHDRDMKYIYVSDQYLMQYKVKEKDVIGKHHYDIFPDLPQKWRDVHQRVLAGAVEGTDEDPYVREDGSVDWTRWECRPWYESDGSIGGLIVYTEVITERKQAEEKLLRSKNLLITILDGIEALVYVADIKTYEILYLNKYGKNIFGDIEGKICWQSLQAGQTGPCAFCTNDKLLTSDGRPADVYQWEFRNTASGRWYNIHDRAVEWEMGRLVRIEIANDITERKNYEEERENLLNELMEKTSELEEVIRVTSHDLRSPLVNVEGYHKEIRYSLQELETILKEVELPQDVKEKISLIIAKDIPESVKYIDAGVAKMYSLLSGLLSLSRSGRSDMRVIKLDMNRLIADVISTLEYQFKDKGARHEISELPSCSGDEKLINQVFSNLIGNALKYLTQKRPGVIKISGYKEDGNVVYCVEDNGIGLSPAEQNKIFEIFHQVNQKSHGEGLGLNIVKKIVQRHKGKVWIESESGKWSKFFVSLKTSSRPEDY